MLLQEPPSSPYDLQFQIFGFPVRIAWTFWLGGLLIGLSFVRGIDNSLMIWTGSSPGVLPLLLASRVVRIALERGVLWGGVLPVLPLVLLLFFVWSFGEAVGYLSGSPD